MNQKLRFIFKLINIIYIINLIFKFKMNKILFLIYVLFLFGWFLTIQNSVSPSKQPSNLVLNDLFLMTVILDHCHQWDYYIYPLKKAAT